MGKKLKQARRIAAKESLTSLFEKTIRMFVKQVKEDFRSQEPSLIQQFDSVLSSQKQPCPSKDASRYHPRLNDHAHLGKAF